MPDDDRPTMVPSTSSTAYTEPTDVPGGPATISGSAPGRQIHGTHPWSCRTVPTIVPSSAMSYGTEKGTPEPSKLPSANQRPASGVPSSIGNVAATVPDAFTRVGLNSMIRRVSSSPASSTVACVW